MLVWDPVIFLKMPGCTLKEVRFSGDIDGFLAPLVAAGENDNFYKLLGDVPPVAELCPLEIVYGDLCVNGQASQTRIVAVRNNCSGKAPTDTRTYSLFLAHAKLASESEMHVRLLPFPSTMPLWVTEKEGTFFGKGLMLHVPNLFIQSSIQAESDRVALATVLPHLLSHLQSDRDLAYAPTEGVNDPVIDTSGFTFPWLSWKPKMYNSAGCPQTAPTAMNAQL